MPIEVEDIAEPAPAATEEPEAPASVPPGGAVERATPEPAPKKRGRPPGSKNKPKVPEEPAPVPEAPKAKPKPKKAKIAPPPPPSESESEDESEADEPEPPSPAAQRRSQWAQYRQRQVDVFQSRVAGYTNILDKMLHF